MFKCKSCSKLSPRFSKNCPHCQKEGSLISEMKPLQIEKRPENSPGSSDSRKVYSSGFPGLDALLPPGFMTTSLYLFAAMAGTGKTTLLFQIADYLTRQGARILYVAGEMGLPGIQAMRHHYNLTGPMPDITFDCDIKKVASKIRGGGYDFVIIDSFQTMSSGDAGRPSYEEQADMSIQLKNLAHEEDLVFLIITQVNRDLKAQGSTALLHNVDAVINMSRGHNGEVILSAPTKNRQGFKAAERAVFVRTPQGLVEKPEIETGHLLRHTAEYAVGLSAAPVYHINDYTTDEFSAVTNTASDGLVIHGAKGSDVTFLQGVLLKCFPHVPVGLVVRANLLDRYDRGADLAVIMAVLSRAYNVPLPVNVAYIGSVDADGNLLLVEEIEKRVRRAKDQGYTQVFGPMAVGSLVPNWVECKTIHEVVRNLELILTEKTA